MSFGYLKYKEEIEVPANWTVWIRYYASSGEKLIIEAEDKLIELNESRKLNEKMEKYLDQSDDDFSQET